MEIWEDFTTGGYQMGLDGPANSGAHSLGTYDNVHRANRSLLDATRREIGDKRGAKMWNQRVADDGKTRISAIFKDDANNAKVRAWVERKF